MERRHHKHCRIFTSFCYSFCCSEFLHRLCFLFGIVPRFFLWGWIFHFAFEGISLIFFPAGWGGEDVIGSFFFQWLCKQHFSSWNWSHKLVFVFFDIRSLHVDARVVCEGPGGGVLSPWGRGRASWGSHTPTPTTTTDLKKKPAPHHHLGERKTGQRHLGVGELGAPFWCVPSPRSLNSRLDFEIIEILFDGWGSREGWPIGWEGE